jgi:hypothetical protein
MSEKTSEFLSDIARKVAESDAQANADLADIMAGRPYKRKKVDPKAEGADKAPAAEKKPRAKRAPAKKRPVVSADE